MSYRHVPFGIRGVGDDELELRMGAVARGSLSTLCTASVQPENRPQAPESDGAEEVPVISDGFF